MKITILITGILVSHYLFAQAQDSLDIKLQQYKDYRDRDLITQSDYTLLKEKLLNLGKFEPKLHVKTEDSARQYNKKLTFEIRIEPVAFFDLRGVDYQPNITPSGKFDYYKQTLTNGQYGGLQIGVGAAMKKRYHIHFLLGFDGNQLQQMVSVGADFNANLLPGKISPFVHVGAGFASINSDDGESILVQTANEGALAGMYTSAGIGLYARLNNFFALAISPDYRFIYITYKQEIGYYVLAHPERENGRVFYNQIGLRVAAVFY